ncbi:GNAT family N-acetyltransferase [Aquimarina sp. 2304DJ70-9]|uniref:GNAT family N-acetyltransferase n=1 Tax=Aquimarina penaris TaxID=3231044 RepID=UPI00346204CE
MQVKNLEQIDFSIIMECFLKAFENYFVKMPIEHDYYKKRWKTAGVRLDLSYGMFDGNTLVGFIINAIDERNGKLIAFNTGTGVLPEYRGQYIVRSIYQFALPELQKHRVSECRLEVIKDNKKAIKIYEGIGFTITKSFKCYHGDFLLKNKVQDFELKTVESSYFDWKTLQQNTYSWDNYYTTVTKGTYDYYIISVQGNSDSYFIMNPENGYISQFNVLRESTNNWIRLFTAIRSVSKTIKINNVDEVLKEKIDVLEEIGLKNTVDQYEMKMLL